MAFHDREYDVFLILGSPGLPPPWHRDRWAPIAAELAPFLDTSRGDAGLRTLQYGADGKPVAFGRLGWDERSSARWTLPAAETPGGGNAREFHQLEAWAPRWTICEREGLAPDFFFSIWNEQSSRARQRKLAFNPGILIASAVSRDGADQDRLRAAVGSLAERVGSVLCAHRARPWGRSVGGGSSFTDALQDARTSNLCKAGDPHARPVDLNTLREAWHLLADRHPRAEA